MDPIKQRIAIAEACGWRRWRFGDPYLEGLRLADQRFNGYIRIVTRVYPNGITLNVDESPLYSFDQVQRDFFPENFWLAPNGKWWKCAPDYLNNLNAMHEAEKMLTGEQRNRYLYALQEGGPSDDFWSIAHATAAQRAEAFLRTIGKWENG